MSLKSWINQYYRVPVEDLKGATALRATKHSLQKWKGLRKDALDHHKVIICNSAVEDAYRSDWSHNNQLTIDDSSCALCQNYIKEFSNCGDCPLYKTLGRRCDYSGPYTTWSRYGNPEPMIKALEKTIIWIKENKYRG